MGWKPTLPTQNYEELLLKALRAVGGEEAVKVALCLRENDEVTDDEVAVKIGVKPNDVRRILYKFIDSSLVTVRRFRDEKTGWYTFKWRLQPDQLEGFILNLKRRVLEKLNQRLEYERTHDFYHCIQPDCPRITFEEAMDFAFSCPNCGRPLQHVDNSEVIDAILGKIGELTKELNQA